MQVGDLELRRHRGTSHPADGQGRSRRPPRADGAARRRGRDRRLSLRCRLAAFRFEVGIGGQAGGPSAGVVEIGGRLPGLSELELRAQLLEPFGSYALDPQQVVDRAVGRWAMINSAILWPMPWSERIWLALARLIETRWALVLALADGSCLAWAGSLSIAAGTAAWAGVAVAAGTGADSASGAAAGTGSGAGATGPPGPAAPAGGSRA